MGFFKQEYWNGLSFPLPGDLPDPGIKLVSPASPELEGRFFITEPPGKPIYSKYLARLIHLEIENNLVNFSLLLIGMGSLFWVVEHFSSKHRASVFLGNRV